MFKHVLMSKSMFDYLECTATDNEIGLQQEQPQLYENLAKILSQEEQQVLQSVFHEAEAKALAAANAEAAGVQTNGN